MNDVIDLGAVSTETRGQAQIGSEDLSTGQKVFPPAIQAED